MTLQVKMLEGGSFTHSSVAEFLNKAVEPPPEISVSNAVRLLQDIGAFEVGFSWNLSSMIRASRLGALLPESMLCYNNTQRAVRHLGCHQIDGCYEPGGCSGTCTPSHEPVCQPNGQALPGSAVAADAQGLQVTQKAGPVLCCKQTGTEQLTVLGRHLAALPLPPRIGKMLLYGVLFGCLDPVLTVTCAMAYRYEPGCPSRMCFLNPKRLLNRLPDWLLGRRQCPGW